MNFRIFLIILVSVSWFSTYSQCQPVVISGANPCSQNLFMRSKLYDDYPSDNYKSFVKSYLQNSSSWLVSDEDTLIQVDKVNDLSDKLIFHYYHLKDTIQLNIEFTSIQLKMDMEKIREDDYLILDNLIEDSLGHKFYGSVQEHYLVTIVQISNIRIIDKDEEFVFSSPVLQQIINPNIRLIHQGLNPIEVYFSPKYNRFFVYIFGEIPELDLTNLSNASKSYLARLIIDPSGKNLMSVDIIPSGYLVTYGWLSCKDLSQDWKF